MFKKRWFTLIEIMIVVTILGVVMIALIPKLKDMQSIARDWQRKVDIKNIAAWLMLYRNDVGKYPTLEDVIPDFNWMYSSAWSIYNWWNWMQNSYDGYWVPLWSSNATWSWWQYYSSIYETIYTSPLGNVYYKSISSQTYYITPTWGRYPYSNTSINLYDILLKKYLVTIPKDPLYKKSDIIVAGTLWIWFDSWQTDGLYDWSYQYSTLSHNWSKEQAFALMANVENMSNANWLMGWVNVNLENTFRQDWASLEYSWWISNWYTPEGETNLFSLQAINPYLSVNDVSKNLCTKIEKISREPLPANSSWLTNNGWWNLVLWWRNNGVCYINTYYLDTNYTYNLWWLHTLNFMWYFYLTNGTNNYQMTDKKAVENLYYKYLYVQANN